MRDDLKKAWPALVLLVVGNYPGALRPNYFIGIRTPWTLEDPEIWQRTHRVAGKLWVGVSLVLLLLWVNVAPGLFRSLFFAGIVLMAGHPLAYSFCLFIRKRRAAPDGETPEEHPG